MTPTRKTGAAAEISRSRPNCPSMRSPTGSGRTNCPDGREIDERSRAALAIRVAKRAASVMHLPAFVDLGPMGSVLNDPVRQRLLIFATVLVGPAIALALLRLVLRWVRQPDPVEQMAGSLVIDLA